MCFTLCYQCMSIGGSIFASIRGASVSTNRKPSDSIRCRSVSKSGLVKQDELFNLGSTNNDNDGYDGYDDGMMMV